MCICHYYYYYYYYCFVIVIIVIIIVSYCLLFQGSVIFQNTDFDMDSDNVRDDIHFFVLEFDINTQPPPSGSFQANDFIGVESFLNSYSDADFTAFCLSYLFTYRDFDGGVLGLAFVGKTNNEFG